MQHFVTVDNLDEKQVLALIKRAQYFKQGGRPTCDLSEVYCVNMFFEDSYKEIDVFKVGVFLSTFGVNKLRICGCQLCFIRG